MPAPDERGRRLGKLQRVDRLMEEAEEARPKSVSPGRTPEASLQGDRSKREDWDSPGELWLRGKVDSAKKLAAKEARYVFILADRRAGR